MPSIKDFEKSNKSKTAPGAKTAAAPSDHPKKKRHPRRPGREAAHAHDIVEDAVTEGTKPQEPKPDQPVFTADAYEENEPQVSTGEAAHGASETATSDEKIHLNFYGSEVLRARLPKTFELAEAVADDWVKDGRFEALPVGHPLAQAAAQIGLRKAKDLEKKLEEKGVFMFARMGYQYAKSKLNRK